MTKIADGYRIRKLTERECFRLMGVCEEYIDLIQAAGISRSQQYKMAGNSIRCVGKYLYDKGIIRKERITIETASGIRTLKLYPSGGNSCA